MTPKPSARWVASTALLVTLVIAARAAPAAASAPPDAAGAGLTLSDLPAGFRSISHEEVAGSELIDLQREIVQSAGPKAKLSWFSFAQDDRVGVVGFVLAPASKAGQADFDRHVREGVSAGSEGMRLVDGGDLSFTWRHDLGDSLEQLWGIRAGPVFGVLLVMQEKSSGFDNERLSHIFFSRIERAAGFSGGGFRPAGPTVPELTTYIPTPLDISTKPNVAFANLLIAALAMLLFTAALGLLEATLAPHEGWLERALPPARWLGTLQRRVDEKLASRLGHTGRADLMRLVGILLFYGIIFSFLEPGWNPVTVAGFFLLLYMTIAFGAVGIADDLAAWLMARRRGLPAELAVRPALALLAVGSTAATRLFGIVPGIMLGTPEAFPLEQEELAEHDRRRLLATGGTTLGLLGGGAWALSAATDAFQRLNLPHALDLAVAGFEAFLVVVFAVTVQNLFMNLLAFPGSLGAELQRISRWLWMATLIAVTFLFLHTLLNTDEGVEQALHSTNLRFFLGTIGLFSLACGATWLGFKIAEQRRSAAPVVAPVPSPAAPIPEIPSGGAAAHPAPDRPQKTCPRCAKEIDAAAEICPYCRSRFVVRSKGYCAHCHRVSGADVAGRCEACGSELIDVHVESGLVTEPAASPRPLPVPKPTIGNPVRVAAIFVGLIVGGGIGLWLSPLDWESWLHRSKGDAASLAPKPNRVARLSGDFSVVVKATSARGFQKLKAGSRVGFPVWSFAPKCGKGACRVRLRIVDSRWQPDPLLIANKIYSPPIRTTLKRNGAVYHGKGTARLTMCESTYQAKGSITVRLHVTKGAWIDNSWRATRVRGSVIYSAPESAGILSVCRASGFTAKLTGSLLEAT